MAEAALAKLSQQSIRARLEGFWELVAVLRDTNEMEPGQIQLESPLLKQLHFLATDSDPRIRRAPSRRAATANLCVGLCAAAGGKFCPGPAGP